MKNYYVHKTCTCLYSQTLTIHNISCGTMNALFWEYVPQNIRKLSRHHSVVYTSIQYNFMTCFINNRYE